MYPCFIVLCINCTSIASCETSGKIRGCSCLCIIRDVHVHHLHCILTYIKHILQIYISLTLSLLFLIFLHIIPGADKSVSQSLPLFLCPYLCFTQTGSCAQTPDKKQTFV